MDRIFKYIWNAYIPAYFVRYLIHKVLIFYFSLASSRRQGIVFWFSDKKRYVFLVNPLVASQSTRELLRKDSEHSKTDLKSGMRYLDEPLDPILRSYSAFAFVRNPWARVLSCYHKKVVNANTLGKLALLARHPTISLDFSFEEFVRFLDSYEGADEFADEHWVSQSSLLFAGGVELFDRFARLEDFPASQRDIFRTIGVELDNTSTIGQSKDMRVSKKYNDLRSYYNNETWEMVAHRYAQDIECFGYQDMLSFEAS